MNARGHNELVDEFDLVQQRWGLCESTRRIRRWLLNSMSADLDVTAATTADIEAWLDQQNIGVRTRRTYLGMMTPFFKWMHATEQRADNPVTRIRAPRSTRMLPRPITTPDLRYALGVADPRIRAWLTLGAFAGLRCCEIAALTRESVLDGRTPPVLVVEHGKGDRQRVVPLHPEVVAALTAYGMPEYGPVFALRRHGQATCAATVSRYVGAFFHGLGMPWTAHNLRHWFGCEVYAASLDLRTTQELLGHASPSTTAGYTTWSPDRGVAVVAQLTVE